MLNWSDRGHVLATCDERVVYCRVVGIGNMNNCAPFQSFSERMQAQGYREYVLDFSHCEGLDSTFLGILLGMALNDDEERSHVVVVNATDGVSRVLAEVGIDRLVEVLPEAMTLPDVPMRRLEGVEAHGVDPMGMILKAHENLCRVGPSNQERFGGFLRLLRKELKARRREREAARERPTAGGT
ncbi:MAG: STAS domain-containing protein [Planctomycetota bacterium]